MITPKPYTVEEEREKFLRHLRHLADYWLDSHLHTPVRGINDTERARMDGFIFSLLVTFDGGDMNLPAMDISMAPHPIDKAYCIKQGERWHKRGLVINECQLHDLWTARERERKGQS